MGRIDLDLAADRQSLWEAAAAALPDAEGEPGRQLLWDDFRMDLVATGRGGTQVRLEHPGGLLASLRWRWWLRRLGASPWGAAEKLALAAGLLTLAAGVSAVAPSEPPPPPPVEEAATPTRIGSLSAAVLFDHELRIEHPHRYAVLEEPVHELDLRDDGLWVDGRTRIPLGVPSAGGGWEVTLYDGAMTVVHDLTGERIPVAVPPGHHPVDGAAIRGSTDHDQLLAYAVGAEVVVVALPALTLDLDRIVASAKGRPLPPNLTMEIRSKRGSVRTRKLATTPEVIEVLEPSDVAGTRLDRGDGAMMLYMPAYKRWSEISGMGRKGSFVGSDLTFEDLELLELVPPEGHHELVQRTPDGWLVRTRVDDSPQYEAVRWWLPYNSETVRRYELVGRDGRVARIVEEIGGTLVVSNPEKGTSTTLTQWPAPAP